MNVHKYGESDNYPIKWVLISPLSHLSFSLFHFQFIVMLLGWRPCKIILTFSTISSDNTRCHTTRRKSNEFWSPPKKFTLNWNCKTRKESLVPCFVCKTWVKYLRGWIIGAKTFLKLLFPMVWSEPFVHGSACYFCTTNNTDIDWKTRNILRNPDLPSTRHSLAHATSFLYNRPQSFAIATTRRPLENSKDKR